MAIIPSSKLILSISLLGGFSLRVAGRGVVSIPRKARALLAYLSMQEGQSVSRETIADLLWTDRGVEQARHSLRQTLLVMRRDLGPDVLRHDGQELSLAPDLVETDATRFRTLGRSADRAALAEAAELYVGPFLHRFPAVAADFDDWADAARNELTDLAVSALGRLSVSCLVAGEAQPAVMAAERMVTLDPLREDSHRALIEAYLRAGRRADAIRQYRSCVEILKRDLDVDPSPETEELARTLRTPDPARGSTSIFSDVPPAVTISARPTEGPPWIAVLPFRSMGPDSVPDYFSAGLVEDVVTLLASLKEPIVVSSHSTRAYHGRPVDLRTIGQELGVRYVVSGSARYLRPWVRISVELAEAGSGAVLWGQAYDTKDLLLFDAQDHIARQIVNTIIPHIHETELRRITNKRPENMTAYDLVLQARDRMFRLEQSAYATAGELLRRAVVSDPAYATAHALMADWHALRVGQGWSPAPDHDAVASDEAARAAIRQDAMNARALSLHAHTRSFLHRDYEGAIRIFEQAMEAAPNDAPTWMWSAGTYAYIGNGTEAMRRAERAYRLSPRDRFAFRYSTALCLSYYTNGAYEDAIRWGEQAIRESPAYTASLRFTIAAHAAVGQLDRAQELAGNLMRIQPDFRVRTVRERHPYRDASRRNEIADRLLMAGLHE